MELWGVWEKRVGHIFVGKYEGSWCGFCRAPGNYDKKYPPSFFLGRLTLLVNFHVIGYLLTGDLEGSLVVLNLVDLISLDHLKGILSSCLILDCYSLGYGDSVWSCSRWTQAGVPYWTSCNVLWSKNPCDNRGVNLLRSSQEKNKSFMGANMWIHSTPLSTYMS